MRISKPKDWPFMTPEEKEKWALDTGNQIQKARDEFRKFLENEEANK